MKRSAGALLKAKKQFDLIGELHDILKQSVDYPEITTKILSFMSTYAIKLFWMEVWENLSRVAECEWDDQKKLEDAMDGRIPLCFHTITAWSNKWAPLGKSNRHDISLNERWRIPFGWDDIHDDYRAKWDGRKYRTLYKSMSVMLAETILVLKSFSRYLRIPNYTTSYPERV
jgi:hypothetical protein